MIIMLRRRSYFPTFATVVVVAVSLILIAPPSMALNVEIPPVPIDGTGGPNPNLNFPPCLSKVQDCMEKNFLNAALTAADASEPKPICCSQWAKVIKTDKKCYCDALASANTTNFNWSQTDAFLKVCNIDGTIDSLCGLSSGSGSRKTAPTGASTKPAGPVSGLMLLFASVFFY